MRRESFFATMSLSFMKPMRKRGKEGYKVSRFHKVSFYFCISNTIIFFEKIGITDSLMSAR